MYSSPCPATQVQAWIHLAAPERSGVLVARVPALLTFVIVSR